MQTPVQNRPPPPPVVQQRPLGHPPSTPHPVPSPAGLPSTPNARPYQAPQNIQRTSVPSTSTQYGGHSAQSAISEETRRGLTRAKDASKYDGQRVIYNPSDAQDKAKAIVNNRSIGSIDPPAVAYAQRMSTELLLTIATKAARIRDHRVENSWGRDGPEWALESIASTSVKQEGESISQDKDKMWHARIVGDQVDPYVQYQRSNERAKQEEMAQRAARRAREVGKMGPTTFGSGGVFGVGSPAVEMRGEVEDSRDARAGSADAAAGGGNFGAGNVAQGTSPVKKGKVSKMIQDETGDGGASGSDTPSKASGTDKKKKGSLKDRFSKPGRFLQLQEDKELRMMVDDNATREQVRMGTGMHSDKYAWLGKATKPGLLPKPKGKESKLNPKREDGSPDPGSDTGSPAPTSNRPGPSTPMLGKRARPMSDVDSPVPPSSKRRKPDEPVPELTSQQTRIDPSSFPPVDPEITLMDTKLALHREIAKGGRNKRIHQIALEKLMLRMAVAAARDDTKGKALDEAGKAKLKSGRPMAME